jgi:hypothetical protein
MANDIIYSPLAPVRWAHLITARTQLDEAKPKAWSCELLLSQLDPKHVAFLERLDQLFTDTHGSKKKRSDKGQPWKADKEDPTITVVKFKATEFVRDDGSKAAGPKVIDSRKQPWDGQAIGNGSKCILAFTCYGWERPEGTGLSLQPKAVQVVSLVPYEGSDERAVDGFEEQEGYSVASAASVADEFADEFSDEVPF